MNDAPDTRPLDREDAIRRLRTGAHPDAQPTTRRQRFLQRKVDRAMIAMIRDGEVDPRVDMDGRLHFTLTDKGKAAQQRRENRR